MNKTMDTFYALPSWPGYGINRRGEVKSPTGVILTVTERGQVRMKKDGKVRLEYIGHLLADAGQAAEMLARERYEKELPELRKAVAKAEFDLGEKSERLRLARKLNAVLLARVRRDMPHMNVTALRTEG